MSRFLFLLWDGGGNVPPQLGIVRRLVTRGHDVRVLTEPSLEPAVSAVGARFVALTDAPHRRDRSPETDFVRDWEARTPIGEFARTRDRVMIGPAARYADDVLVELRREPADALVVDWLLFGGALAGETAGMPTALICHNPWMVPEPGRPAPGLGFGPRAGLGGRVRDSIGNRLFTASFDRALPTLKRSPSKPRSRRARVGAPTVRPRGPHPRADRQRVRLPARGPADARCARRTGAR